MINRRLFTPSSCPHCSFVHARLVFLSRLVGRRCGRLVRDEKNQELKDKFGFSDDYLTVIAQAAQTFVKRTYRFIHMQARAASLPMFRITPIYINQCSVLLLIHCIWLTCLFHLLGTIACDGTPGRVQNQARRAGPAGLPELPWDAESETLSTTAEPGEDGASCTLSMYYCGSQVQQPLSPYHSAIVYVFCLC